MDDLEAKILRGESDKRLEAILQTLEQPAASAAVICAVVRCLDDDHPGLRQAALESIGHLARAGSHFEAEVLDRAIALTMDSSRLVRAEAAVLLALLADDRDHPPRTAALRRMLADDEATVRQEAAAALGDLLDREAIEKLAVCLDDPDGDVRFEAAFALAAMQDRRARPLLETALERKPRRLDAMKALGLLADPSAVPALERFIGGFFVAWADRLTAHATLYKLGRTPSAQAIVARTKARNFQERTYAMSLIGSHRVKEGADVLIRIAKDTADQLRDTAIRALGALQDSASVPALLTIATDNREPLELRCDATEALLDIPGDAASHALKAIGAAHDDLAVIIRRRASVTT